MPYFRMFQEGDAAMGKMAAGKSISKKSKKERRDSKIKNGCTVLLFVLPAFIPLIIFWIYPILRSIWISFTDWDFMTPRYNFIFLKNYATLFKDRRFYNALWNILVFTAVTLLPTILGGRHVRETTQTTHILMWSRGWICKVRHFSDCQYIHGISIYMDDHQCIKDENGNYGCQCIFTGSPTME